MAATQIYFASPSGNAITLQVQRKSASVPSHGMYRAEIDAKPFIARRSAAELLDFCLRQMTAEEHLLVGVHAGPSIELDIDFFSRVGESKKGVVYHVRSGVPRNTLESLAALPYGEIFVIGYGGADDLGTRYSKLTDIETAMTTLGDSANWAIGYDTESAILTVLSREGNVVKSQIIGALELELDSGTEKPERT